GLTVMFSNMPMYATCLAVPLFVAQVLRWPPWAGGLLLSGLSVPRLPLGPVAGRFAGRSGTRPPPRAGCADAVGGGVAFTCRGADWSRGDLLLPLIAVGVGMGLSSAPVHTAALQAARHEEAGRAAGLFSTMRYVGSISCSAGIAAVLGASGAVAEYRLLFVLLVGAAAVAVLTSSRLPASLVPPAAAARAGEA